MSDHNVRERPSQAARLPADKPHSASNNGTRARRLWRESTRHLSDFAERNRLPLRILDANGACRWANRSWLQSTGRSLRQVVGSGWLDDVHPEERDLCAQAWRIADDDTQTADGLRQVEYRMRRSDGSYHWVLEVGTPRITLRGRLCGFVGAVLVTPGRQQAEVHTRRYKAQLRAVMSQLLIADEEERRSLAEDLHDGLGQTLTLAQLKLSALRSASAPGTHPLFASIQELIEQASRATRTITFEISPPVLHDLGLRPAVLWLVDNIRQRYGLDIELSDDGSPLTLDDRLGIVLFRATRELLINAAKHAQARHVFVQLGVEEGRLVVRVEDDGIGMQAREPDSPFATGGSGLIGIQERLNHLGGEMQFTSQTGLGTRIRLCVPLMEGHPSRMTNEGGLG